MSSLGDDMREKFVLLFETARAEAAFAALEAIGGWSVMSLSKPAGSGAWISSSSPLQPRTLNPGLPMPPTITTNSAEALQKALDEGFVHVVGEAPDGSWIVAKNPAQASAANPHLHISMGPFEVEDKEGRRVTRWDGSQFSW